MNMIGAEIYLHTIDWSSRLRREIPVLREIIGKIKKSENNKSKNREKIRILDLGCGPGKHLAELVQFFPNDEFSGLDLSPEMIKIAIEQLNQRNSQQNGNYKPKINYFTQDFLEINPDGDEFGKFHFIYSLGNSILLMMQNHTPKKVFTHISQFLERQGYFFFQILNNEKPRQGYVASSICETENGDKFYTLKRFQPNYAHNLMEVEFMEAFQPEEAKKPQINVHKSKWPLITHLEIVNILKSLGFSVIQTWGNYAKENYNHKKHDSLLLLAQKN